MHLSPCILGETESERDLEIVAQYNHYLTPLHAPREFCAAPSSVVLFLVVVRHG